MVEELRMVDEREGDGRCGGESATGRAPTAAACPQGRRAGAGLGWMRRETRLRPRRVFALFSPWRAASPSFADTRHTRGMPSTWGASSKPPIESRAAGIPRTREKGERMAAPPLAFLNLLPPRLLPTHKLEAQRDDQEEGEDEG